MSPDDFFTQVEPRRRPRRRKLAVAGITVVVIAGAAGLVSAKDQVRELMATVESALPGIGPVPEETEAVDARPEELGPFEDSRAENYANGAAGLVMPPAKAMYGLSKKDVAAALKRVKQLMIASHLDRTTVLGGRPKAFIDLLVPEERAWFRKNLDRKSGFTAKDDFNTRAWVHSFAPKTAELATDVVKVNGETTLARHPDGMKVTVNYLFVYAIQRPGQPRTRHRVVAHHLGEVHVSKQGGELVAWVYDWNTGSVTPARCDIDDGFTHPIYPDSPHDEVAAKATEQAGDPYRLDAGTSENCTISEET
ncbi:hypothetical protein [Nonomuraea sp. bgisy101]|uniref:hypothetical protein n=1 Tax=Nonomuraea sp. bgisy101 TaxID=3413784 RepID=UPI003D75BFF6